MMNKLLAKIHSWFAWELKHDTGVYHYMENTLTKKRKYKRVSTGGHQPLAQNWLNGGEWNARPPGPAPFGGSAVTKSN